MQACVDTFDKVYKLYYNFKYNKIILLEWRTIGGLSLFADVIIDGEINIKPNRYLRTDHLITLDEW